MKKFVLASSPIEISEFPNHKEATFLISVLDEYNSNGVLIQKAEGEKYHETIIGYPILAFLKYDAKGKPSDFGGHELRKKYNSETKEIDYYFATHPIGSVTESWIESREVDGYEGEKDCILIKTKLWKSRFPEYFKVFDELWDSGKLSSSWEISTSKSKKTSKGKILEKFEFIGNAVLGSNVTGAVKGAGVLEVASDESIYDLSTAFLKDIQNEEVSNEGGKEMTKEKELSSLTENDVYSKVRKAINKVDSEKYYYVSRVYPYEYRAIAYEWDRATEEDYIEFTYTVNSDDTISITGQKDVKMKFVTVEEVDAEVAALQTKLSDAEKEIAAAGKLVSQLSKEKEDLETEVSELTPYKTKVEDLEAAELEKELASKTEELKAFALEEDLIEVSELEENETLKIIFSELTLENFETSQEKIEVIKGRKAIAKFKEKQQAQKEDVEFSQAQSKSKVKSDLSSEDSGVLSAMDIVKAMVGKK